ncbi:MAG: hypothetical protein IK092_04585 [Muribaculaceae bacterium]|nr:hypothetical protein [Muribaculaceae bacterium]
MRTFNKILLIALGLTSVSALAANQPDYEGTLRVIAQNITTIQECFTQDDLVDNRFPDKYTLVDIDHDGNYEVWVRSYDEQKGCLFTIADGKLDLVCHENYRFPMTIDGNLVIVSGIVGTGYTTADYYLIENSTAIRAPFTQVQEFDQKKQKVVESYITDDDQKYSSKKAKKFLKRAKKDKNNADYGETHWESMFMVGTHLDKKTDITLSQRPMFSKPEIAKNIFTTYSEEEIINPELYNKMIFKSNVNNVKYNKDSQKFSNQLYLFLNTFKLENASGAKKMFRGYNDKEAAPIVVKESFLLQHTPLQYSRWKSPETIKTMSKELQNVVKDRYLGREIKETRWMANVPSAERDFYAVTFVNERNNSLASIISFSKGEIVSAWDSYALSDDDPNNNTINENFIKYLPEIQSIVATPAGLELYVRNPDDVSFSNMIMREIGNQLICIQHDYVLIP